MEHFQKKCYVGSVQNLRYTVLIMGVMALTAMLWTSLVLPGEVRPRWKQIAEKESKTGVRKDPREPRPLSVMREEGRIISASFSPDGSRIVTWAPYRASSWNLRGKLLGQSKLKHASIMDCKISPDGLHVFTCYSDGTAYLWDIDTGAPFGQTMEIGLAMGHGSGAFSRDGRRLVTWAGPHLRVWNSDGTPAFPQAAAMEPGMVIDKLSHKPDGSPIWESDIFNRVIINGDGTRIATSELQGNIVRIWNPSTGKPVGQLIRHGDYIATLAFSPDGLRIVTAAYDGTARLWDAETGLHTGSAMRHSTDPETHKGKYMKGAEFNPGPGQEAGRRILTTAMDSTARIWDAATGQPTVDPLQHPRTVYEARYSPDATRIATYAEDRRVRLWDAATGKSIGKPISVDSHVTRFSFSPNSALLVIAHYATAEVWDTSNANRIGFPMRHKADINSVQFSPDGMHILTSSSEYTACLWETPQR
ncbi:MAG: WD40 repeat domain-containing protein [Candidatus Methylacidiphilales bacterium]|nr:WD40 repeat domain-containing protein [Candidatus Methylacidiphilales bacterium]